MIKQGMERLHSLFFKIKECSAVRMGDDREEKTAANG